MAQLESARKGIVTPQMKIVAEVVLAMTISQAPSAVPWPLRPVLIFSAT